MTAINRRITTRADVEATANEPEGETIDYKSVADASEWWELAKDIAAFANHLGGVILVGASEQPNGLPNHHGLPPAKVAELVHAYDMAGRDKCRPSPLVTCDPIKWDNGREILAVNVAAYAGGLVGARFYELNSMGAPQPADAWQFHMRVGKHNSPLPLEQAIMHMSSQARRTAIFLSAIGEGQKIKLALRRGKGVQIPWDAVLARYSIAENFAEIKLTGEMYSTHGIPFEDIEAVWLGGDSFWHVRISGFFHPWTDKDGQKWVAYIPGDRA